MEPPFTEICSRCDPGGEPRSERKTDKGAEAENTCGTMFLLKWSVGSNFALHSFEVQLPWQDRELMSEKKKRCLPTPEGGDGRHVSEKTILLNIQNH